MIAARRTIIGFEKALALDPERHFSCSFAHSYSVIDQGFANRRIWTRPVGETLEKIDQAKQTSGSQYHSGRICARGMTKAFAEFARKVSVVVKTAGMRNLAERLRCLQRRAAMKSTRGMLETNR